MLLLFIIRKQKKTRLRMLKPLDNNRIKSSYQKNKKDDGYNVSKSFYNEQNNDQNRDLEIERAIKKTDEKTLRQLAELEDLGEEKADLVDAQPYMIPEDNNIGILNNLKPRLPSESMDVKLLQPSTEEEPYDLPNDTKEVKLTAFFKHTFK